LALKIAQRKYGSRPWDGTSAWIRGRKKERLIRSIGGGGGGLILLSPVYEGTTKKKGKLGEKKRRGDSAGKLQGTSWRRSSRPWDGSKQRRSLNDAA